MTATTKQRVRFASYIAACFITCMGLFMAAQGRAADDQVLFAASGFTGPNVVFLIDTSGSMREILRHEDYADGDGGSSDCRPYGTSSGYSNHVLLSSDASVTHSCPSGNITLKIFADPAHPADTGYDRDYLNWLMDGGSASARDDIEKKKEKYRCLKDGSGNPLEYYVYQRTRTTASKRTIEDVICLANQDSSMVRFGIARFRSDSDGAWIVVPAEDWDASYALDGNAPGGSSDVKTHPQQIEDIMRNEINASGGTPLAESLFQVYTYFMSRTQNECPYETVTANVATPYSCCKRWRRGNCRRWGTCYTYESGTSKQYFPTYQYATGDSDWEDPTTWHVPPSPVKGICQNNYVVVLSDGEPTSDTFSGGHSEHTKGFNLADGLLGGEDLDDVSRYMYENDMYPDDSNPDFQGKQNVAVYTVGFAATSQAEALLKRAADDAGGENFNTSNTDELTQKLIEVVNAMIQGPQSFAASSVPSSRQSLGSFFYTSYFKYLDSDPFWEGHLMALNMSLGGGIFDKNWKCALDAPDDADVCRNGDLMLDDLQAANSMSPFYREPVFDVATLLTNPLTRNLYVSRPYGFGQSLPGTSAAEWDSANISAADLDIKAAGEGILYAAPFERELGVDTTTASTYAATIGNEDLADVIVDYAKGCNFGSVLIDGACDRRENSEGQPKLLGDIFHSSPRLVTAPSAFGLGSAYIEFRDAVKWRPIVIYAGANDGFLHAFKAGDWVCTGVCDPHEPPTTFVPDGEELFGFMPWVARKNIKQLPIDAKPVRDYYFVDGSPTSNDVWINRGVDSNGAPTKSLISGDPVKLKEQWRTVLIGGMRQGGGQYYALDVTDPTDSRYPGYLWEFPCEKLTSSGTSCSNPDTAIYEDDGFTRILNSGGYGMDDYIGETWSDPVIYRIKVQSAGRIVDRWVTIFGGGYSPEGDPLSAGYDSSQDASTSRKGRGIFVVDIATGEILAQRVFDHSGGTLGSIGDAGFDYAFAASPRLDDYNSDGYLDHIYFADLGGNIWRWDVSKVGNDVGGNSAQPDWDLEKFWKGDGKRSIYYPPAIARVGGSSVRWLITATGNRSDIMQGDVLGDSSDNDRVYVIRDIDSYDSTALPLDAGDLQSMTSLDSSITKSDYTYTISSTKGYYLVGEDTEKFLTRPVASNGKVIVGSFLPGSVAGCQQTGDAYQWTFDLGSSFSEVDANDDDDRKKKVGPGLIKDPILPPPPPPPPPGCDPSDPLCEPCPEGACCGPPDAKCSGLKCDPCAMSFSGSSTGGMSAECTSCQSPWLPQIRSWREE